MIHDAAGRGCDVVVLPECLDLGWTHASGADLARPVPGPTTQVLADAARACGILVAAGVTERAGGRRYNAAVLLSRAGELLLHHRKINEVGPGRGVYATGRRLEVVDTEIGAVGLAVCADNLPPALAIGHALGLMGADLVLSPSAWAVRPDHDDAAHPYGGDWEATFRELAVAHRMHVVGVSNVGPVRGGDWDGWRCIGASRVVGPTGDVLLAGPYGERAAGLLTVDL